MPRNRGTRKRIARGIYRDDFGYEVRAIVGSGPRLQSRAKRYPHNTALSKMVRWQEDTRVALRLKTPRLRSGTLHADIARYLPLVKGMPSIDARRAELDAWAAALGHERTGELTTEDLRVPFEAWRLKGAAASTLNHRRNSLAQLYAVLYPAHENPAAALPWTRPDDPAPRALPLDVIDAILDAMPRSPTRARLKVMAETGLPPVRIKRLQRHEVDLQARVLRLEGRRKGAGTKGRSFPLTARAVAAFEEFISVKAFGPFSSAGMSVSFQRAVKKVNAARAEQELAPLPPVRPYDLRHSFGTRAYLATGDLRAAAELLDCSEQTALRYTLAAVPITMQRTVDALNQR